MRLALTRRGEYPEPVAREFDQLVTAINASSAVEHDADGRQRVVCGKWFAGAAQSLADSTLTRIVVTRPESEQATSTMRVDTVGQVRIGEPGVYLVIGQITFDSSPLGRRAAQLRLNNASIAIVAVPAAGYANVQVSEAVPCSVGDTVSLFGYQETGGALSTLVSGHDTWLRIVRVG